MNNEKFIDFDKVPATTADKLTLLGGFLAAIKILIAAPPFNFEIPQETLDAVINFGGFVLIGIAIYRNNRRRTYN